MAEKNCHMLLTWRQGVDSLRVYMPVVLFLFEMLVYLCGILQSAIPLGDWPSLWKLKVQEESLSCPQAF